MESLSNDDLKIQIKYHKEMIEKIKAEQKKRFENRQKQIVEIPIDKFLTVRYWKFESGDISDHDECKGCKYYLENTSMNQIDYWEDHSDWKLYVLEDHEQNIQFYSCADHTDDIDFNDYDLPETVKVDLTIYPEHIKNKLLSDKPECEDCFEECDS